MRENILFSLIFLSSTIVAQEHLIYQSPINGSKYHRPETPIILRADGAFDKDVDNAHSIRIAGSKSGLHTPVEIQHTPADVLVLDPGDFMPGETVTVQQSGPLTLIDGNRIEHLDFSFSVGMSTSHPRETEEHIEYAAPYRRSSGLPAYSIDVNTNPYPAPIFFRNTGALGDKYYGIIGNDGSIYSLIQNNHVGQNFTLQESGWLTAFDNSNHFFLVLDSALQPFDTLQCGNGYIANMHDCRYLGNGHQYMMAYDDQVVDMSQLVAGGNPAATVTGTILQELDAQGTVVFEWRTWDHFQITDATLDLTQANIDYAHGNSIDIMANGDWVVSFRNMDEITKIDGTTGSIIWRFSGKNNQFAFVNDTEMTSKQHDARIIANGHLTVLDNGNDHTLPVTKAKEYALDESAMTATLVWSFTHPNGAVSSRTGNVQRLPNGNTFINWGYRGFDILNPNWTEVTAANNIVYQFRFTAGTGYNTYRAMRNPWDTLNNAVEEAPAHGFVVFPNPGREFINIRFSEQGIHNIRMMDFSGRMVKEFVSAEQRTCVYVGDQSAGMYWIVVDGTGGAFRSRYLLLK